MKSKKTKIINALIFLGLIVLTFWVIFKNNNINDVIKNIKSVDIKYILIGLIIMFIFSLGEATNIHIVLKSLGEKTTFLKTFKYAVVGFFFSSITPSASGGQPLQIYYMNKDNVSISHSLISLIVELFTFQVASCVLAIIGFIFNYDLFISIGNIKFLFLLGFLINLIILISLLVILFSRRLALKFINFIAKILRFIHYKKTDLFYENALKQIDEYHDSAIFLKNHKIIFVKTLVVAFVKLFLYHSIPYFVYLAFGLHEYSIFNFVFIQSVLYCAVSSLPFPGAMGVSEGSFVILFKMLFPEAILSSAMVISRGINFYLFVIITGFLLFIFTLIEKLKKA